MIKIEKEIKNHYNKILNELGKKVKKKYKRTHVALVVLYIILACGVIIIATLNNYSDFITFLSIIILVSLTYFIMSKMESSTLHSLGYKKKSDYIQSELRKFLIQRKLFHSKLLEPIIASLDNKAVIKFNPALLISFLFFMFNPMWNYFITKQLEEKMAMSEILSNALLLPIFLCFLILPIITVRIVLRSTNKSLISILNEFVYESIYKELNKNDYVILSETKKVKYKK
ncbi:hypothetical protein CXR72_14750 [Listeria monocytogenes]|uniref:Uncharacterized protein n=1 Tax=Listeria monocytogenes TaxID=1639 RepID=A0A9P2E3C5_LISMN|nr:hypothetical protein [Listeria monocytogenes]EAA0172358.1 hypothetical protein [Listeria monocytogenes]EAA0214892.1 hypothetical protein [Listeria monocytogenes]EAC2576112.1 hypothetical protein [Listeria monocytogenes]EAC2582435.1 hypothetical protein [Listeria monocytogenes]EAC2594330.1 hypothetical protein [Listeria monocytogenes]